MGQQNLLRTELRAQRPSCGNAYGAQMARRLGGMTATGRCRLNDGGCEGWHRLCHVPTMLDQFHGNNSNADAVQGVLRYE